MSDYNNNNEHFASSGVGTAGLTLGVIGTALASGIVGNGGFGGLFGNNSTNQQVQNLMIENAILKADASTDKKLVDVYATLRSNEKEIESKISGIDARVLAIETASPLKEQLIDSKIARVTDSLTCCCNASNVAIASLQNSVAELFAMTTRKIDAERVCPLPMARYNSWVQPTTATNVNVEAQG